MTQQTPVLPRPISWRLLLVPAALGVVYLWAYWPNLVDLAKSWSAPNSPYSHGFLVPAFAVVLLWLRRDKAAGFAPSLSWWGLLLLAFGCAFRFVGNYLFIDSIEALALLPTLAGLFVLFGGKAALRWAWPAIAFLAFMIPLPFGMEVTLAHPLQGIATLCSTYALQTLGFPALSEGNVIHMGANRLEVEQACSGLSMMVVFFALSTAVAFVIERPMWQKLVVLVSAFPIAVIANVTRIAVTGILYETVGRKVGELVFHDLAGWLMMPFALGLLWIELQTFARLVVEVAPVSLKPLASFGTAPAVGDNRGRHQHKKRPLSPVPHHPRRP